MTTSQGKKSSGSFLRRALSLLVVTTFITTNHFTAFSFAQTISAEKNRSAVQSANPMRLSDLNIPESIGKADEIFTGTSVQTVILIQDAHAIPDAQHSITRLIDHFQQNYGIDTVALEGASAGLDPEMFKTFPDQETLKKVFKGYHEKGELAGGVAAAIFNTRPGQYRGIEDWNIYQDGIRLYLEAMKRQPVIREKLLATTKELRKEKESSYPPKLLEVDRLMETFQANGANLLEVMEKLAEIKAPAPGSELALLVEESRKGSESDADLNIEVKRLADEVKRDLTALKPSAAGSQLTAFNKKYQEFQTSGITPEAFASFMKDLVVEFRLPVKVSEKLRGSVKRQQRMEDIQGTKLFEDFEKYADGVADSLMTDGKQREISRRSRELRLLERFNRLELTHEDWRQLQKMDPRSKIRDAGKKEKSPGNSYLVSNILNLASEFQDHFAFYKNAIRRDSVLFDNLRKLLTTDRESSGAVIAVAGGFHARGLTRLLKDADISYALLMPAIQTLPDQTTYRDQMEGKVSWKDSFKVENGKVSLYNAFVRGTRDRLLLMVPGTAGTGSGNPSRNVPGTVDENSVLKNWRDNIIRDMAGKNKITESGQYTRFIDELVKAADDRVPAADDIRTMLMAKVEKFIDGLRRLETEGRLTEPNIIGLTKPAAIQAIVVGAALAPADFAAAVDIPVIAATQAPPALTTVVNTATVPVPAGPVSAVTEKAMLPATTRANNRAVLAAAGPDTAGLGANSAVVQAADDLRRTQVSGEVASRLTVGDSVAAVSTIAGNVLPQIQAERPGTTMQQVVAGMAAAAARPENSPGADAAEMPTEEASERAEIRDIGPLAEAFEKSLDEIGDVTLRELIRFDLDFFYNQNIVTGRGASIRDALVKLEPSKRRIQQRLLASVQQKRAGAVAVDYEKMERFLKAINGVGLRDLANFENGYFNQDHIVQGSEEAIKRALWEAVLGPGRTPGAQDSDELRAVFYAAKTRIMASLYNRVGPRGDRYDYYSARALDQRFDESLREGENRRNENERKFNEELAAKTETLLGLFQSLEASTGNAGTWGYETVLLEGIRDAARSGSKDWKQSYETLQQFARQDAVKTAALADENFRTQLEALGQTLRNEVTKRNQPVTTFVPSTQIKFTYQGAYSTTQYYMGSEMTRPAMERIRDESTPPSIFVGDEFRTKMDEWVRRRDNAGLIGLISSSGMSDLDRRLRLDEAYAVEILKYLDMLKFGKLFQLMGSVAKGDNFFISGRQEEYDPTYRAIIAKFGPDRIRQSGLGHYFPDGLIKEFGLRVTGESDTRPEARAESRGNFDLRDFPLPQGFSAQVREIDEGDKIHTDFVEKLRDHPEVLPNVVSLLDSDRENYRESAAWILGELGFAAQGALLKLQALSLSDDSQYVRREAESAIKKIERAQLPVRLGGKKINGTPTSQFFQNVSPEDSGQYVMVSPGRNGVEFRQVYAGPDQTLYFQELSPSPDDASWIIPANPDGTEVTPLQTRADALARLLETPGLEIYRMPEDRVPPVPASVFESPEEGNELPQDEGELQTVRAEARAESRDYLKDFERLRSDPLLAEELRAALFEDTRLAMRDLMLSLGRDPVVVSQSFERRDGQPSIAEYFSLAELATELMKRFVWTNGETIAEELMQQGYSEQEVADEKENEIQQMAANVASMRVDEQSDPDTFTNLFYFLLDVLNQVTAVELSPPAAEVVKLMAYAQLLADYPTMGALGAVFPAAILEKSFPERWRSGGARSFRVVDWASGPGFADFLPGLDSRLDIVGVDNSPYVQAYQEGATRIFGRNNFKMVMGDVRTVEFPEKSVDLLRIKNVWNYVPVTDDELQRGAAILAPGGSIVFATDNTVAGQWRRLIDSNIGFLRSLESQGWRIDAESDALFSQLIFTRPGGALTDRGMSLDAALRLIRVQMRRQTEQRFKRQLAEALLGVMSAMPGGMARVGLNVGNILRGRISSQIDTRRSEARDIIPSSTVVPPADRTDIRMKMSGEPSVAVRPEARAEARYTIETVGEVIDLNALNSDQRAVLDMLFGIDQAQLFDDFDPAGENEGLKRDFLDQVIEMDRSYPGGLRNYYNNAKVLLRRAKDGVNPFAGYKKSLPPAVVLESLDQMAPYQEKGLEIGYQLAYGIPAGGLGERLGGRGGIKLAIPFSLAIEEPYLRWYQLYMEAIARKSARKAGLEAKKPPVFLMTSVATDTGTKDLLQSMGWSPESEQISLAKQGAVPALHDIDAHFVKASGEKYKLEAKPHGHGDIHALIKQAEYVRQLRRQGYTKLLFFQDTNGQVFNGVLAALGAMAERGDQYMWMANPARGADEKAGGLVQLTDEGGRSLTANIEYNYLLADPQMKTAPLPGNPNVFLIDLELYENVLERTRGIIAEFANPKFTNAERTAFTPARLETMMQDLVWEMVGAQMGITQFTRRYWAFSPVKNDELTAAFSGDGMLQGESDFYQYNRDLLRAAGVDLNASGTERRIQLNYVESKKDDKVARRIVAGNYQPQAGEMLKTAEVPWTVGAIAVLYPNFAVTVNEVKEKIKGGSVSDRSALIVDGEDVHFENLRLDGSLVIRVADGVKLTVRDLEVKNAGWELIPLTDEERFAPDVPDYVRQRGYKLVKHDQKVIEITEPGEYEVGPDGQIRSVRAEARTDEKRKALLNQIDRLAEVLGGPSETGPAVSEPVGVDGIRRDIRGVLAKLRDKLGKGESDKELERLISQLNALLVQLFLALYGPVAEAKGRSVKPSGEIIIDRMKELMPQGGSISSLTGSLNLLGLLTDTTGANRFLPRTELMQSIHSKVSDAFSAPDALSGLFKETVDFAGKPEGDIFSKFIVPTAAPAFDAKKITSNLISSETYKQTLQRFSVDKLTVDPNVLRSFSGMDSPSIVRDFTSFLTTASGQGKVEAPKMVMATDGARPPGGTTPPTIPPIDTFIRNFWQQELSRMDLTQIRKLTPEVERTFLASTDSVNKMLSQALGVPDESVADNVITSASQKIEVITQAQKELIQQLSAAKPSGFFGFFQRIFLKILQGILAAEVNAKGRLPRAFMAGIAAPFRLLLNRFPGLFGLAAEGQQQILKDLQKLEQVREGLSRAAILKVLFGFLATEVGEGREAILDLIKIFFKNPDAWNLADGIQKVFKDMVDRRAEKEKGIWARMQSIIKRKAVEVVEKLAKGLGLGVVVGPLILLIAFVLAKLSPEAAVTTGGPESVEAAKAAKGWLQQLYGGLASNDIVLGIFGGLAILFPLVGLPVMFKFLNEQLFKNFAARAKNKIAGWFGIDLKKSAEDQSAREKFKSWAFKAAFGFAKWGAVAGMGIAGLSLLQLVPLAVPFQIGIGVFAFAGFKFFQEKKASPGVSAGEAVAPSAAVEKMGAETRAGPREAKPGFFAKLRDRAAGAVNGIKRLANRVFGVSDLPVLPQAASVGASAVPVAAEAPSALSPVRAENRGAEPANQQLVARVNDLLGEYGTVNVSAALDLLVDPKGGNATINGAGIAPVAMALWELAESTGTDPAVLVSRVRPVVAQAQARSREQQTKEKVPTRPSADQVRLEMTGALKDGSLDARVRRMLQLYKTSPERFARAGLNENDFKQARTELIGLARKMRDAGIDPATDPVLGKTDLSVINDLLNSMAVESMVRPYWDLYMKVSQWDRDNRSRFGPQLVDYAMDQLEFDGKRLTRMKNTHAVDLSRKINLEAVSRIQNNFIAQFGGEIDTADKLNAIRAKLILDFAALQSSARPESRAEAREADEGDEDEGLTVTVILSELEALQRGDKMKAEVLDVLEAKIDAHWTDFSLVGFANGDQEQGKIGSFDPGQATVLEEMMRLLQASAQDDPALAKKAEKVLDSLRVVIQQEMFRCSIALDAAAKFKEAVFASPEEATGLAVEAEKKLAEALDGFHGLLVRYVNNSDVFYQYEGYLKWFMQEYVSFFTQLQERKDMDFRSPEFVRVHRTVLNKIMAFKTDTPEFNVELWTDNYIDSLLALVGAPQFERNRSDLPAVGSTIEFQLKDQIHPARIRRGTVVGYENDAMGRRVPKVNLRKQSSVVAGGWFDYGRIVETPETEGRRSESRDTMPTGIRAEGRELNLDALLAFFPEDKDTIQQVDTAERHLEAAIAVFNMSINYLRPILESIALNKPTGSIRDLSRVILADVQQYTKEYSGLSGDSILSVLTLLMGGNLTPAVTLEAQYSPNDIREFNNKLTRALNRAQRLQLRVQNLQRELTTGTRQKEKAVEEPLQQKTEEARSAIQDFKDTIDDFFGRVTRTDDERSAILHPEQWREKALQPKKETLLAKRTDNDAKGDEKVARDIAAKAASLKEKGLASVVTDGTVQAGDVWILDPRGARVTWVIREVGANYGGPAPNTTFVYSPLQWKKENALAGLAILPASLPSGISVLKIRISPEAVVGIRAEGRTQDGPAVEGQRSEAREEPPAIGMPTDAEVMSAAENVAGALMNDTAITRKEARTIIQIGVEKFGEMLRKAAMDRLAAIAEQTGERPAAMTVSPEAAALAVNHFVDILTTQLKDDSLAIAVGDQTDNLPYLEQALKTDLRKSIAMVIMPAGAKRLKIDGLNVTTGNLSTNRPVVGPSVDNSKAVPLFGVISTASKSPFLFGVQIKGEEGREADESLAVVEAVVQLTCGLLAASQLKQKDAKALLNSAQADEIKDELAKMLFQQDIQPITIDSKTGDISIDRGLLARFIMEYQARQAAQKAA